MGVFLAFYYTRKLKILYGLVVIIRQVINVNISMEPKYASHTSRIAIVIFWLTIGISLNVLILGLNSAFWSSGIKTDTFRKYIIYSFSTVLLKWMSTLSGKATLPFYLFLLPFLVEERFLSCWPTFGRVLLLPGRRTASHSFCSSLQTNVETFKWPGDSM